MSGFLVFSRTLKTAFKSQRKRYWYILFFRPIIGPALPPGFMKSAQKSEKGRGDPGQQVSSCLSSEVWKYFEQRIRCNKLKTLHSNNHRHLTQMLC